MKNMIKILVMVLSLAALVLVLLKHFPSALNSDQNKIALVTFLVILSNIIFRISRKDVKIGMMLNQVIVWIFAILVIVAGYSYKHELTNFSNQVIANIIPSYGQQNENGSMVFYAGNNGHFLISAEVNDYANINFLLDTGATTVSLMHEDAKSLGINLDELNYNVPLDTANGMSWGARIIVDKIQIGDITVKNINATVSKQGSLSTSLLGMSFLNKIKQFQIEDNKLTLVN